MDQLNSFLSNLPTPISIIGKGPLQKSISLSPKTLIKQNKLYKTEYFQEEIEIMQILNKFNIEKNCKLSPMLLASYLIQQPVSCPQ
jgi:hypothetical protein